jgi:FMN phosphatase YigB (HAD superfamily)
MTTPHSNPSSAAWRTLRESGLMAIYDGVTTIDEIVQATIIEE